MGSRRDVAADLVDVELHHLSVGKRQRQRRPGSALRADGTEQIGILVALIGGLSRSCAAPRPLPDNAVLLADAGLVLKPYLDRRTLGQIGQMGAQRVREVFLKASTTSPSCAGWRGRALICEKPSCFSNLET